MKMRAREKDEERQRGRVRMKEDMHSAMTPTIYRSIEESTDFGFWACDRSGNITHLSDAFLDLIGLGIDSCRGLNWAHLLHPDDAADAASAWYTCVQAGSCWERELRIAGAKGEHWVLSRGAPVRDGRGRITGWAGVNVDITGRKRAENALLESRERFRLMIANSPDRVFHQDLDSRYVWISNPPTGLSEAEILGKTDFDLLDGEEAERLAQARETVMSTGMGKRVEVCFRADGTARYYDVGLEPSRDASGRTVGIAGYMREITSRRQMEASLRDELELRVVERTQELRDAYLKLEKEIVERRHAEEELNHVMTAIHQASDCVVIVDLEGTIIYVNPAFLSMTEYVRDEVLRKPVSVLADRIDEQSVYRTVPGSLAAGEMWAGLVSGRKKDGGRFEAEVTVSPVRSAARSITSYVAVARDVTEERQLERQLRQAQKMEAIGTLAGGIAHDFNNIIAAIIGFAEMAMDDAAENTPIRRFLDQILRSGMRGRDLVRQILTFSRQTDTERKPVQVSLVVKEALKLLRASIPATIEIRQDIPADSGMTLADATEIHQVVINLVTNAAHAMTAKGGVLKVAVCDFHLDDEMEAPDGGMPPRAYLRLTVSDTGHGMERTTIDRIFDPFFTTKKKGEGTGLGLSVVQGIVKAHGGAITVESTVGRGTTFNVYLPRVEDERRMETTVAPVQGGTEHILFVDDEEALVELAKETLERLGYKVTATTSSARALTLFRKDPRKYDVVITDQTMPHMTGIELAGELIAVREAVPVILCTGFSQTVSQEEAEELGVREFLFKPVVKREMAAAIRRVLDVKSERSA